MNLKVSSTALLCKVMGKVGFNLSLIDKKKFECVSHHPPLVADLSLPSVDEDVSIHISTP